MKKFGVLLSITLAVQLSYATVRNVPSDYAAIQAALESCMIGDTVLVQPGIYYENIYWPDVASIKLFSAGDSTNTIIDGNQNGSVITMMNYIGNLIIDTTTMIRGFKITGGSGFTGLDQGGGIYISGCSPDIEETSISGNTFNSQSVGQGAGLYLAYSNAIFINCLISANQVKSNGDINGVGIYITGVGTPKFYNVTVAWNYGSGAVNFGAFGAGVYCESGSAEFYHCIISNNSFGDSAIIYAGGGMYCFQSEITLSDVVVSSNTMGDAGEGYSGAGIHFNNCIASFTNVVVSSNHLGNGNVGESGAGMYLYQCATTITNARVTSNINGGGYSQFASGISLWETNATLTNVLISNNLLGGSPTSYEGGGIFAIGNPNAPSFLDLINVTIANNKRANNDIGQGIGIFASIGYEVNIINSILWDTTVSQEIYAFNNNVTCSYSDVFGGFTGIGNINADPAFISDTDFHLLPNSPCLGTGDLNGAPAFDLDNNLRPLPAGSNPDIGCYEMDESTALTEFRMDTEILIYPNPVANTFTIEIPASISKTGEGTVIVYDLIGTKILSLNFKDQTKVVVDVSSLNDGIYVFKIQNSSDEVLANEKFVKN